MTYPAPAADGPIEPPRPPVGHTGSFSVMVAVTERVLTWFSGDVFEHTMLQNDAADVHDILKDIDDLMGPDPADDPPEVPPILELIPSEWQRLVSMDSQFPDFISLLSTLTTGVNRSSTIKLQDENARIVLGALDEVSRPQTVAQ